MNQSPSYQSLPDAQPSRLNAGGGVETTTNPTPVAQPNLNNPPETSVFRLYNPTTRGNSFSLDGFPTPEGGNGWLAQLIEVIERQGILGMTTNQTLFRSLMDAGLLDDRLKVLKEKGKSAQAIYRILYNEAATAAGRAFARINARWPWEGRVSQEASALLTELDPLLMDVQRISQAMQGVGAFTKIPNLPVGPRVIEQAVASQVQPNVTLVFSDRHYLQTVEGYLAGLEGLIERLKTQGTDAAGIQTQVEAIHSVNSLFVSRVDRWVDPMIEEILQQGLSVDLSALRMIKGKTALAQAKLVYRMFEAVFLGKPFLDPEALYTDEEGKVLTGQIKRLAQKYADLKPFGAQPQRLLIASSGVKAEQPYSKLLYVLPLLGPWAANTLPESTLKSLSRFVAALPAEQTSRLQGRSIIGEPFPALPTDIASEVWDEAVLLSPQARRERGIAEVTPDWVLGQVKQWVLGPQKKELRALCDTLRDKGAASFMSDEKAILEAIEKKLKELS